MNLKSNIKAQYVSVVLMFLGVVEFIYHYLNKGLHFDAIPIVGNEYTQVIGVFIFTLAYTSLVRNKNGRSEIYLKVDYHTDNNQNYLFFKIAVCL